ncbi:MAG: 8-oxo-dGTP diphosphatase [Oscillospiraceae bacterium]|nr:8-oxo-dGTP diphosphatase [Oscillospiraceae bacterium]
MDRRETVELTVLCLIHRGEELLLQKRDKGDWSGYAPPGGHVEPGESIVDAVIREIREETGLTVISPRLCGIKQFPIENGRYLVFLFESQSFSGTLRSSEEGTMEWIRKSALSQHQCVEDLEPLLDVMLSDSLTEFQYLVNGDDWIVNIR